MFKQEKCHFLDEAKLIGNLPTMLILKKLTILYYIPGTSTCKESKISNIIQCITTTLRILTSSSKNQEAQKFSLHQKGHFGFLN